MTATVELRKLLDERGVEHEDSELIDHGNRNTTHYTEWGGNDDGDGANVYVEYTDGTVLRMFDATPEQAVVATLGSNATKLREKLNKLVIELDRLDITLDSPVSNMTVGEYEQEREKLLDGFIQAIAATLGTEINGDTSDGYHTFNELYHHRAVLFSVIVRDHRELAWKARKHHDGTMYDGMFIVGIETPGGQATYHYDLDPYWGMFDCEEREFAPEWDGHTPDEAIARIAELKRGTCRLEETENFPSERGTVHVLECSECGRECEHINGDYEYCPHCLARNVLF